MGVTHGEVIDLVALATSQHREAIEGWLLDEYHAILLSADWGATFWGRYPGPVEEMRWWWGLSPRREHTFARRPWNRP